MRVTAPTQVGASFGANDPALALEIIGAFGNRLLPRTNQLVKELSYEWSDPTVESQIVALKASGADTFYDLGFGKFASQAIRKASEIGWKPLHFLFYGSQSISAVLQPAGLENSVGIISTQFFKDPTDPQ